MILCYAYSILQFSGTLEDISNRWQLLQSELNDMSDWMSATQSQLNTTDNNNTVQDRINRLQVRKNLNSIR